MCTVCCVLKGGGGGAKGVQVVIITQPICYGSSGKFLGTLHTF